MLGTVVFYTAFLSTILPIYGLRDQQLDTIIKLLESRAATPKSSSSEESSGSDEARSVVEHNLNTMDVINLIQQANKNKKTGQDYNNRQRFGSKPNVLSQFYEKSQYDSNRNEKDNYGIKNQLLEQLLNGERKPKNNYHEHLTPNRLLNPNQYRFVDEDREPKGKLNEYSKIFVILDPIALQKSRNTDNLPNLLSRILAQTSSAVDKYQDRNKDQRHKGFLVKDSSKSRRFRRESKEKYGGGGGGGGDMDEEYRPKRQRNDHNGGGGGGGRTAIPYIRHRGDIYEKDH